VDDLIVHRFDEEKYLLVVNAANIQKDWIGSLPEQFWCHSGECFDNISQLAVQGPMQLKYYRKSPANLEEIHSFTFITGEIGVLSNVIIAATGYTGSGGFELYFENKNQPLQLWEEILQAGKELILTGWTGSP